MERENAERDVNDADDREYRDGRRETVRRIRKERQAEADHAVRAHFQEDAGEHHGTGGRGLDVRVGQPRVEREKRNLDGEGYKEGEEEKRFRAARQEERAGL